MENHAPGIRTRVLLLTSLALIIAGTTSSSLFIIRSQLRRQVLANLETDLGHSVETFQDLEAGRPMELEAIAGAVVELGERLGIAMPHTRTVYAATKLLDRISRGEPAK